MGTATRLRWLVLCWARTMPLIAAALAGCSSAAMVSAVTPAGEVSRDRSIAYGPGARQQLDVYAPKAAAGSLRPVVVFFYGGRWSDGHRGDYFFVAEALVSRGYLVVVPDYRLFPDVRFPAFVEDGAAATAWTLGNIASYGGDPTRVYLMGHSAGAHIAAMLATDDRYLATSGVEPTELAGVIGLAGPYDFLPLKASDLKQIFGPPARYPASQPVNFVNGREPPLLLLHGDRDRTVLPRNTKRLAERVRGVGGTVTVKIYPDVDHIDIVAALARLFRDRAPVLQDVSAFIGPDTKSGS